MHEKLGIRDLPEDQRPRERLIQLGAESLSDAELLGIILRVGNSQTTAIGLAQKVLKECGGFRGLDSRTIAELCSIRGIGPAKAAQIKAALAIGKKLMAENDTPRDTITTSEEAFRRVALRIRNMSREVFIVIFLTARNRVIKESTMFEGSLTESQVSPREVIKEALNEAAASVIFVHNHPSGDPAPSSKDRHVTVKLKNACKAVGISVHDHIIIGGERYFSFADNGIL
jgi:DNA repair protein RadC